MRYLAASVIIAAAAAVYGLFSHGVFSYFMTYAFMIPLLAGALPHLLAAMKANGPETMTVAGPEGTADAADASAKASDIAEKLFDMKDAQFALVATLTAGSLLKGALDIYGTSNALLIAYPVMGALIIAAAAVKLLKNKN